MKKHVNLKKAMELSKKLRAIERGIEYYNRLIKDYGETENVMKRLTEYEEMEADTKEVLSPILDQIDDVIAEAQGKARERTITAEEILDELADVEQYLDISKACMDGIKVDVDLYAQHFPRAYKYIPMSTTFTAEYKNGSWRLTGVERDYCRRNPKVKIIHTEQSAQAIINRFREM